MINYDNADITAVLQDADTLRDHAPDLHALLIHLGPLADATPDHLPEIWAQTYNLRPGERALALLVLSLTTGQIRSILTEIQLPGATDDCTTKIEEATKVLADAADQLQEAAELLQTTPSRD
ncbi:hypothetical protein ACQEU3_46570 [Spirillospora sp. CA-253888]